MSDPGFKEHNRRAIEQFIRQLATSGRADTALGEAARWGRLDLLDELLASGLDVNSRTETGGTALMLAASDGQTKLVNYLIECGADVNAVDEVHGRSALMACLAALHSKQAYLALSCSCIS